jgi:Sigma-70 region 2
VKFSLRVPNWRCGFEADLVPSGLLQLTGRIAGKEGTNTRNRTVRAPAQRELRELTDADLVRLAQQGDAAAFEQTYRAHSRRVYALCLRMIGNPADAEEFTQDAFLQLFRKIHTFAAIRRSTPGFTA